MQPSVAAWAHIYWKPKTDKPRSITMVLSSVIVVIRSVWYSTHSNRFFLSVKLLSSLMHRFKNRHVYRMHMIKKYALQNNCEVTVIGVLDMWLHTRECCVVICCIFKYVFFQIKNRRALTLFRVLFKYKILNSSVLHVLRNREQKYCNVTGI